MLTDLEKFAVSKAFSSTEMDKIKGDLPTGEHDIDLVVNIYGKLSISHTEKKSTTSIPWLKAMAIALKLSGIQKDKIIQMIDEAAKISIAVGKDEIAEMLGFDYGEIESLEKKIKDGITLPPTSVINTKAKLISDKLEVVSNDANMMIVKVA